MEDYSEHMECLNCGWEGGSDSMPDSSVCPECGCEGYVQAVYDDDDEEEDA